jgi:hypothetical protein
MREEKTESYLVRGGFKWSYNKSVPFTEIDFKASEDNPARLNRRIDNDRAFQYAQEMETGVQFPAIVLLNLPQPHDGQKWLIATGVHRYTAAGAAGIKAHDAYLVTEPDLYRREVLCRQLNALEGQGITVSEQITQVLWLNEHYPSKSITQLTKEWGLKLSTVQAAAGEQRTKVRARSKGWDLERVKVPQKTSLALGAIQNDNVFEKAVELVCSVPGVSTSDAKEMAAEVKKARDEVSQLATIKKWRVIAEDRARLARSRHGRIAPGAANKVVGDIRRVNNQLVQNMGELHVGALNGAAQQDALILARDCIENLKRFVVEIERVQRMTRPPLATGATVSPELHP